MFTVKRFDRVDSTNRLAASGKPGEVFVAAEQTAGRGRLDHKWHSRPGENLLMSVVLDVSGITPAEVATLPLLAGLAVTKSLQNLSQPQPPSSTFCLKWPNDVYIDGHKVCGILCERHGDNVVIGIGVNVRQCEYPEELQEKATSLLLEGIDCSVDEVTNQVLESLKRYFTEWVSGGFASLHQEFAAIDFLKGRTVTVMRTDEDAAPVHGLCGGIAGDGSLVVNGENIYAGEVRW